ncbi:MAG TPA: GNAT family N-acetyltransferase [Steroidobacteraceae bacterium]
MRHGAGSVGIQDTAAKAGPWSARARNATVSAKHNRRHRGQDVGISLRRARAADAGAVGEICYRAFRAIAESHGYRPDIPSPEVATDLLARFIGHAGFWTSVAEIDGRILGSNVLDERNPISGVGPITIDPALQNEGAGRALMQAVMRRSDERGFVGVRLVQAGYHCRSLALYLKLGFQAREQLACLQGPRIGNALTAHVVRPASVSDLPACNRLCLRVHGHDRGGELADAVTEGVARVVERAGRITGYATPIAFFGHAVAETNEDLMALIGTAESFPGPGFLVPTRNAELIRWCLEQRLRIVQTMTLMSIGLYNQPDGAWLPSVTY